MLCIRVKAPFTFTRTQKGGLGMDDRDIVSLYFERDEAAIAECERAYGQYCRTVAMGILDNPSDAEECVNDTWVAAWGSIPPKKPAVLRTYLGKLTRNIAINRLKSRRRQKRNAEFVLSLSELAECIPAPNEEEDDRLRDLLDEFLASAEPLDRKLFVGRHWYNRSVSVLAQGYGLTPNAVSIRLTRMRERLRTFLKERGYDP
ncbi:MAG: sigma-70 family RNA polymerase sigma factor [Ruminococcaceae bacterium]|nr:sigma-70 family RNA polymerase sigma factor [Oscillospiraceae bacterium]